MASATAKQERAKAEQSAGALPASLTRIGEAEGQAERTYRASVEKQLAADATGIPRLSAAAEAAIGALRIASDENVRGEAWRALQKDERISAELGAFAAAVAKRFGDEGVRQMLRAQGRPEAINAPSIASERQRELDQVAGLTATLRQGERANATLAQRQSESERLSQRRGPRM